MANRFCNTCGKELDENIDFCTNCGEKIKKEKKSHKGLIFTIIIIALLLILLLLWFLIIKDNKKEDKEKENDVVEKQEEKKEKFKGYLYPLNEGYGWAKDSDNKYYYLINDEGKVITKVDYTFYGEDPVFIDGYSQLKDNIYNTKGEIVFSKKDDYKEMKYVGGGYVYIKISEETYKGSFIKSKIYDLKYKNYVYESNEDIKNVTYLDDGMFLFEKNVDTGDNEILYNSENLKTATVNKINGKFLGTYNKGYIAYHDTSSNRVLLVNKNGQGKLIYTGSEKVGAYSDGLIYIEDAFYDSNGNKVIDLAGEGVEGTPEFVNGYALIYFKTGYFTILSKETKEYMFTPRKYTMMSYYYNEDYELGIFEGQAKLTSNGYLLVKKSKDKKVWAIMDHNGEIIKELEVGEGVFSNLTDYGYLAVDGNVEDYYFTVEGKIIKIVE